MSSKKKIAIAAGVLVGLGAIATVAAQQHRGWEHGGRGGMGRGDHMGMGMGDGDMRGRGWFNRSLTKDEHDTRTRERFARLDKNGDGFIDAAEIEASFADRQGRGGWMRGRGSQGGPGGQTAQPGQRMLDRFDTNKDGKVTKDEFQAHVKKRFAEMDLNNDGKISDDDLPPMMRGRNVLAGEGAGQGPGMGGGMGRGGRGGHGGGMGWLRGADANKDGAITLDEALAAATKEFDRFDRNKDGTIDTADFEAMRKEMADYRVKRFIHNFGADKDGKVSKDQFFAKANERFAQMDRNNDGTISRDEMPGRRGMMGRGGMHGGMGGDGPMGGPGMGPGMGQGMGGRGGMGGPGMGGPATPPSEPKKN